MKAALKPRINLEGRTPLETVIPLATPFIVFMDPASSCNFTCTFCPTGHRELIKDTGRFNGAMKYDVFTKAIDDLAEFGKPIKVLRMYKDGEPFLNKRLADREFVAGDYSIADMASYPWVVGHKNQGQNIDDFPHLKRWLETIQARPATVRAYAKAKEVNPNFGQPVNRTEEERRILFGQTAAVVR